MYNYKRSVGPLGVPNNRLSSYIGFVYIPLDLDRERYIRHCYTNERITIITDRQEMLKDVYIPRLLLQEVVFPMTRESYGSPIVCVNIPIHNKFAAVAVLKFDDDSGEALLDENTWGVQRSNFDDLQAAINIQGENGTVGILSRSNGQPNSFKFYGNNEDGNNALVDFEVRGEYRQRIINDNKNIEGDKNLVVSGNETKEFAGNRSTSTTGNETKTVTGDSQTEVGGSYNLDVGENASIQSDGQQMSVNGNRVNLGNGSSPVLKGNETVAILRQMLQLISQITVIVQGAPTPITNAPAFVSLISQLNSLLSQKTFTE